MPCRTRIEPFRFDQLAFKANLHIAAHRRAPTK
jgi:hypothetical protein